MDSYDFNFNTVAETGASNQNTKKKRKWREIEALKEKHRLQRELLSIDMAFEDELNDMDF